MGDLESFIGDHLGLSDPWKVTDVSVTEGPLGPEDHIHVDIPFGKLVVCPCCGKQCKVYDRLDERVWRNLDIMSRGHTSTHVSRGGLSVLRRQTGGCTVGQEEFQVHPGIRIHGDGTHTQHVGSRSGPGTQGDTEQAVENAMEIS